MNPAARFCGGCGAQSGAPAGAGAGGGEWIVGSGDDVQVHLSDPSVSRRHLAVARTADPRMLSIRDMGSSNGTYFRSSRIESALVSLDDVVQLGRMPVPVRSLLPRTQATSATAGRALTVGRDQGDIRVDLAVVSGRHAEVRIGIKGFEVRDVGSSNGTYVDGERITGWTWVPPGGRLQLGSYRVPQPQLDRWQAQLAAPADARTSVVEVSLTGTLTLGRDPASTIVIDHPAISWNHARVEVNGDITTIVDLHSSNGVFVNGEKISSARVSSADAIRLGPVPIELKAGAVVAPRSYRGEIRLDARSVTRALDSGAAAGRVILDDVSLTVFPGEMVALMGPSGAGKTTLLEVLTGQRRPSAGSVLINGVDLHDQRHTLADRIGYVPQEDVMHRDLTVFEVLHYAARLRLPSDLPDSAVQAHVEALLTRMGLAHIRDTLIGGENVRGVSGGQRKRVNIALELLTEPPLLFLDEPTSGLDATSTLEVMNVLRSLADEGKTIVMTIHQPRVEAFRLMDMLLLLAKGGKLAYFGPGVPGAAEYFASKSPLRQSADSNPADYALDVLDPANADAARPPAFWQTEYHKSAQHQAYVTSRAGDSNAAEIQPPKSGGARRRSLLSQTVTLTQRILSRKSRDGTALFLQALQPVIVGGLLALIFGGGDMGWPMRDFPEKVIPEMVEAVKALKSEQVANKAHAVLFLVAATAFWLGCSNVARELVADRPVFRRERMAGLSTLAYLTSTFLVQAAVGLAQVTVLCAMVWGALPLQSTLLEGAAIAWLTLTTGIGVGMLVSASVRSEVTAISSLPLLLLPQLMLAGYLQLFGDLSEPLQALASVTPVRWAFSALVQLEYDAAQTWYTMEEVIGFPEASELPPALLMGAVVALLVATYARLSTTSSSTGS